MTSEDTAQPSSREDHQSHLAHHDKTKCHLTCHICKNVRNECPADAPKVRTRSAEQLICKECYKSIEISPSRHATSHCKTIWFQMPCMVDQCRLCGKYDLCCLSKFVVTGTTCVECFENMLKPSKAAESKETMECPECGKRVIQLVKRGGHGKDEDSVCLSCASTCETCDKQVDRKEMVTLGGNSFFAATVCQVCAVSEGKAVKKLQGESIPKHASDCDAKRKRTECEFSCHKCPDFFYRCLADGPWDGSLVCHKCAKEPESKAVVKPEQKKRKPQRREQDEEEPKAKKARSTSKKKSQSA